MIPDPAYDGREHQPTDAATLAGLVYRGFAMIEDAPSGGSGDSSALMRAVHKVVLFRFCESLGLEPDESLLRVARDARPAQALAALFQGVVRRYGQLFCGPLDVLGGGASADALVAYIEHLYEAPGRGLVERTTVENIGQAYEQCLALCGHGVRRKNDGVFYTPVDIVDRLLDQTLGPALVTRPLSAEASIRVLDPACGSGVFLVRAYQRLMAAYLAYWRDRPAHERRGRVVHRHGWTLTWPERLRILQQSIHGADIDGYARALTCFSLLVKALERGHSPTRSRSQPYLFDGYVESNLAANVVWGDSLLGPDYRDPGPDPRSARGAAAPPIDWGAVRARAGQGFHVVVGNPPWGQKAIVAPKPVKDYLRATYPSSRGIFDWFRPFVELGIRLTDAGGHYGMVLPDIVLLKNYEPTRRLLLDELAITHIEALGMAFSAATIDGVTIAGRRERAAPAHRVTVRIDESGADPGYQLLQRDFRDNPRATFNLYLTDEKRAVLRRLGDRPRLGDFFEAHEGIHSGNIRAELFVADKVDETCHELLFGRDELRPYQLGWDGRYVRLGAMPARRTRARYANLGRIEWYQQPKLLVRRTGDRVTAALDTEHRFASNNFFVVIPKREHPLALDGLCALLNSTFITWYFRTIEPRQGRVFAELKIKHMREFPLPSVSETAACERLNQLGARRRELTKPGRDGATDAKEAARLDRCIDASVADGLSLESNSAATDRPGTRPRNRRA